MEEKNEALVPEEVSTKKLTPDERKTIIDKLCDLFTMKSAIALLVCVAFCYRTFRGEVNVEDLKTIFMVILTAYFTGAAQQKSGE